MDLPFPFVEPLSVGYPHPDVMGLQAKLAAAKTNVRVM